MRTPLQAAIDLFETSPSVDAAADLQRLLWYAVAEGEMDRTAANRYLAETDVWHRTVGGSLIIHD